MADLDAELLALAGGDSSEDETLDQVNTATKIDLPSPSIEGPENTTNSASANKAALSQKRSGKMSQSTKKSAKQSRRAESEEGEASPNSLESAPMSESEGERSPASGSDNDSTIFPLENKFYSEKDKAEIMALSEVKREEVLAERAQILERKQQDQILRRLYQGYQAKEEDKSKSSEQKKRKAATADLEEGQRKSSRQKTTLGGRKVGETSNAIEAYKRQREQKGILAEQRKTEAAEHKARKLRGSSSPGSDVDADGESVVEWDDGKPQAGPESRIPDDQPADLADFNRIHIGRDNFAKVCFYPGFENAIKNCYSRISIGPDKATGENIYRLALIKDFTQGKPYAMDGVNGKPFTTNQYAQVAVGRSEKEWPFIACSNSKFTEREFERYKRTLVTENLTAPTKSFINSKIADINKLLNHRFTEEELQTKLKRSGVLQHKFDSIERASLNRRRQEAEYRGDEDAVAQIDQQLAALDGPKLAFGTSLFKIDKNAGVKTQQQRLGELNRANRKANTENVRRAQQKERKLAALNRLAVERGEAVSDPFARVKVMAKTHHIVGEYLNVPANKPVAKTDNAGTSTQGSREVTPKPEVKAFTANVERVGNYWSNIKWKKDKYVGWVRLNRDPSDEDVYMTGMDWGVDESVVEKLVMGNGIEGAKEIVAGGAN